MGRRKNNNPQTTGTRGPGRKSRKQQAPEGMDYNEDGGADIALGVHDGRTSSRSSLQSPPTRSTDRGAKLRAQSMFTKNQDGGVSALTRKTRKLALTPPEVIMKPYEGEPLKSALKHTPSPRVASTVSSTISKLSRQRAASSSPSKSSEHTAVTKTARNVKFSESPQIREMTLSETEEDRQPLQSTLLSILASCMNAELEGDDLPPAKKRRKKKLMTTKKGSKTKSKKAGESGAAAADEAEIEEDEFEIDVPTQTPIDFLQALVDMSNTQEGPGSLANGQLDADDDENSGLPNALIDMLLKQKRNISPMKSKKTKKSNAGGRSSTVDVDDEQSSVLLNDADVDEIEKLNESVVAATTSGATSPSKKLSPTKNVGRSSPASTSKRNSDLSVLMADAPLVDAEDSSSDEDFEPSAADFEKARRDALWKPNVDADDEETMDSAGNEKKSELKKCVSPAKTTKATSKSPAKDQSASKASLRKSVPAVATPVEVAAAVVDVYDKIDGNAHATSHALASPVISPQKTAIKGRRSINQTFLELNEPKQQQQNDANGSDTAAEQPTAPAAASTSAAAAAIVPEEEDDLIVSTQDSASGANRTRTSVLPQIPAHVAADLVTNRVPEQLAIVENRMQETMQTLAQFDVYQKAQTEAGLTPRPRQYFVEQFIQDMCTYYSYNEFLMRKLEGLFQHGELVEFCEANEASRPLTIRVNSLKARRKTLAEALIQRGVNLDPIPGDWTKVGLVIYDSKVPIGATPEYLAGHYMLQGASSLLPVMALAPKPGESILDMCAAPGGKSTHIAAVMKNTGMLVANDANRSRCKAITANMARMGVVNAIISSVDGRKLPEAQQKYHRILLDAPCSGTGVLARDPSAKMSKNEQDMLKITTLQKELILAAIRCLKPDGVLVYSTCSVLVEENESVVQYALNKCAGLKLVETGITFGVDGFTKFREHRFDAHMKFTKRFYPHVNNMDGFFVSKMRLCGPAKFNTDLNAPTMAGRATVQEFGGRNRGRNLQEDDVDDEDVDMPDADEDGDDDELGVRARNKMVGNRNLSKRFPGGINANAAAATKRRAKAREGARDRKKRKFSQSRSGMQGSGSSSMTGDKMREQQRTGSQLPSAVATKSVNGPSVAGSLSPKKFNAMPNGIAHAPKLAAMTPAQPSTSSSTLNANAASSATRKEPAPASLFQRVKNRVDEKQQQQQKRRSDIGKPVGLGGMRLKKKSSLAASDAAATGTGKAGNVGADKNSRKTIGKKRFV